MRYAEFVGAVKQAMCPPSAGESLQTRAFQWNEQINLEVVASHHGSAGRWKDWPREQYHCFRRQPGNPK